MKKKLPIFMALGLISGCATYNLDLLPRSQAPMAHGVAKQIDKSVAITIGPETYTGKYAYVQGGSFSLGSAISGSHTITGSAIGISAVGSGNILAQAPDGHNLRCVFNFSGWSQEGAGTCLTDTGLIYDLQITK